MALTTTTLASACALNDRTLTVASATGFVAGYKILIDGEFMEVDKSYVSGTAIPVLRGREGTAQAAHVVTSNVTVGIGSDWANPAPGAVGGTTYFPSLPYYVLSMTTTGAVTLPSGRFMAAFILNGTSAITPTFAAPTKDQDGSIIFIASNGVAQHIPTFTGGLNGVGSGYTALTGASGAKVNFIVMAVNGYWNVFSAPAWTGTVTKLIGGIA